jgi:cytochrome c-type biogenesis protein CcmH
LSLLDPTFLLWFAFAVLTGAVVWLLLSPMAKRRARAAQPGHAEDVALYKDQLAEIDRDVERGVLAESEAEAARIEVSRRLLAAADATDRSEMTSSTASSRRVALTMMVLVPALSLGIYLTLGSPNVPDAPFAPRIAGPAGELPLDALIVKVEKHLKAEPDDLRGWEVLAPAYLRQGNFVGSITAWSRAMALDGQTAIRLAARGEARVFAANGSLTPAAREDFAAAVAQDAMEPRAQYYLGLADIEDGHSDKAIARWQKLIDKAPADAPWRASIEAELTALKNPAAKAPGPSADQAAAAANMTPEDRQQMINGMVEGLAARLEEDPSDLGGWLRLIRAYGVLGRADDAAKAVASAQAAFADDAKALAEIAAAAEAQAPQ